MTAADELDRLVRTGSVGTVVYVLHQVGNSGTVACGPPLGLYAARDRAKARVYTLLGQMSRAHATDLTWTTVHRGHLVARSRGRLWFVIIPMEVQ